MQRFHVQIYRGKYSTIRRGKRLLNSGCSAASFQWSVCGMRFDWASTSFFSKDPLLLSATTRTLDFYSMGHTLEFEGQTRVCVVSDFYLSPHKAFNARDQNENNWLFSWSWFNRYILLSSRNLYCRSLVRNVQPCWWSRSDNLLNIGSLLPLKYSYVETEVL